MPAEDARRLPRSGCSISGSGGGVGASGVGGDWGAGSRVSSGDGGAISGDRLTAVIRAAVVAGAGTLVVVSMLDRSWS
jgi:hypothetical protein